jgi:hypothetical protein
LREVEEEVDDSEGLPRTGTALSTAEAPRVPRKPRRLIMEV